MSFGFLKLLRTIVLALLTVAAAGGAIGFTWYVSERTTQAQAVAAEQRADTIVSGLAAGYSEQINRHILALDQTLETMTHDWEADPRRFNLETERARARILAGISRDMFLADENGIIRQASVPDFIGESVADLDVFRDAAQHVNDKPKLYLGGASVNPIMRQWHLDAARTLHHPDGSFAGIIDADYRLSAINDVFAAASPPGNGFAGLISLTDGKLRLGHGAVASTPDASIADTPMFGAVDADASGLWVGPSSTDTVVRIHGYRRVPGSDLVVIVGMDRNEVLQPVSVWRLQTRLFTGAIAALILFITALILGILRSSRRRVLIARENLAQMAAAHALAEVARAQSEAVGRRLQATFASVTDGIAIFDAHLNLIEWNPLFPERSGVNASFIRTGMPMEDVLRTQAQTGCFGVVEDVEAEVQRRAALLRAGNFGASQVLHARDRAIELRCRPLPEGGFVALYADVTEARRARRSLREAHDALVREQTARGRFLGVIAFELRARVATLSRAIARLRGMQPRPDQLKALERLRGVGETIAALATDTVEVPLMEAGELVARPALVTVGDLLRDVVDTIQPAAEERGITVYLIVNEAAPAELIADPDRIRQIVASLLIEAIDFAAPDTMWLLAEAGETDDEALRVTVRFYGSPLSEPRREALFPDLLSVAAPDPFAGHTGSRTEGTRLAQSIARHLAGVMGGRLRCEGWSTLDGRTGNDLILTLPVDLLPGQRGRAPGEVPVEGRPLPRTRVLLIGAETGLRLAAVTMLRRDGHMVDSVPTAEGATRLLAVSPYDIVFMDTGLPDATVERATDLIRDMAGPAQAIPLVLLGSPHDAIEERGWRAAGVTDMIASQPTLDAFSAAIARNVWQAHSTAPRLGFMPGLEEELEEGIPVLATERISELQANLPPEELAEMVEECIGDLFHRLPALRRALAVGSSGAIMAQAHAMVGMAGGYGMAVLEARLRAIQTAVRTRRLDTIDGAATVVENDLARAAAALRRTLRSGQPVRSGART